MARKFSTVSCPGCQFCRTNSCFNREVASPRATKWERDNYQDSLWTPFEGTTTRKCNKRLALNVTEEMGASK